MAARDPFDDPQTYAIIGAAMEVHRALGSGFLESVYRRALAIECGMRGIPFVAEVPVDVTYKAHVLAVGFRADFICYESVIVEVKALAALSNIEHTQVINYLKATGLHRAVLLNFGTASLQYRRIVWHLPQHHDPFAAGGLAGVVGSPPGIADPIALSQRPQEPGGVPGDGDGRDGAPDSRRQ